LRFNIAVPNAAPGLAACILRMAATELVAIQGMQRKMVGL
jgi:hypothetical protein